MPPKNNKVRCEWCGDGLLYQKYHDQEWGVPCFDEKILFEFLLLEGAQAGLSWITILNKRENYRAAFDDFDAKKIAAYSEQKIISLKQNAGIVRNELKIRAAVNNAQRYFELCKTDGSLSEYLWAHINGKPIQNSWLTLKDISVTTALSDTISKDLKKRGFKFFGSTICYAFMQAVGMANDHVVSCYRHQVCKALGDNY